LTTLALTNDQIDSIVVDELKAAYDRERGPSRDGGGVGPDWDVLDAIEAVLRYYMSPSEFNVWLKSSM